jgi:ABC-type Mn2+/Zn2+ transport system permease subunit
MGSRKTVLGFALSIPRDLPTGPTIVAVSGVLAAAVWLLQTLRRVA